MKNRASLTAEYVALFRALESSRPASSRLFHDPFAVSFLRGRRRWLYRTARFELGRRLVEQLLDQAAPGARADMSFIGWPRPPRPIPIIRRSAASRPLLAAFSADERKAAVTFGFLTNITCEKSGKQAVHHGAHRAHREKHKCTSL